MSNSPVSVHTLDPQDVARLLLAGELLLIDVREPAEYAAERIAGALNFPLSTFDATALPIDVSMRIVFHCGIGKRSQAAAEKYLAGAKPPRATHMGGGLSAWKAAGLPVIGTGAAE
jgi:rhodanese-related sulfurtransferase